MIWKTRGNKETKKECDYKNIQEPYVDLNDESLERIDRLVDRYESDVVRQLNSEYKKETKRSDRLADHIAHFGGSWRFIIIFSIFLITWIVWNTISLTHGVQFDRPPYILLNLCLSFIAAFQAPIIMMSQNRAAARDKHESVIDFAINYKDGQEIDDIQARLQNLETKITKIMQLLEEK